ncbi:MAG TPA: hypothetical protein HPP94_15810 [Desulfuromonadales bacterium]|nr:hypothetical protein [Desulfuromonadales bacterium]
MPDWFGDFETFLREGDFKAVDLCQSRKCDAEGHFSPHMISRISLSLANFDFREASVLLKDVRNSTPTPTHGVSKGGLIHEA